jgi:ankyrin repeat protein
MAPAIGWRLLQNHDKRPGESLLNCGMKMKYILTVIAWLAASGLAAAATNDLTTLLERGLLEEEANHQLDAAIRDYQEAIDHFDRERQLAATAIFRLGECYRKLGRTNEANAQYERVTHEFPDQTQLAQLSQAYLPSGGAAAPGLAAGSPALPSDEAKFLSQAIKSFQTSPDLVNDQLGFAVQNGYTSAVEFLIAHGADLNAKTPLLEAAREGNEAMVQLLLSHGAAVDNRDGSRRTALFYAAEKGFVAVCRTLLAHGADINAKDVDGSTPLHDEVAQRNLLGAEFLITNNAHIDAKNNNGETPLFTAIRLTDIEMVQMLLAHHADANMESSRPRGATSPLLIAIDAGDSEIVKALLENHADPNAMKSSGPASGMTPLMWALSEKGRFIRDRFHPAEVVQMLLDHGAKPNAVDANGQTALVYAIQRENIDAVRLLLEHGADANLVDKRAIPPLAHLNSPLSESGRQIQELLIKAGADADYNRRRGIWTYGVGGAPQTEVFQCPSNSINHYTLLDVLATLYEADLPTAGPHDVNRTLARLNGTYLHYNGFVPFPDFARVSIHRLEGKRAEVLHVNVEDILQSGDASKDVALQPGDLIEIAKQEHKVADKWYGLSSEDVAALTKCLVRTVQVISQDHTNDLALVPSLADAAYAQGMNYSLPETALNVRTNWLAEALKGRKADTVFRSFLLNKVARDANVLLNTWDLSRVRLTRGGSQWTFDLTKNPPPDVWLENGDIIEIPELGEAAPAADAK